MKRFSEKARAAGAGALLLVAGMALGIVVDRTLLAPAPPQADALTVESLAEHMELSAEQAARLRILLDSLHTRVMAAAAEGPEAMRAATQAAHLRIEATLDPDMRPEFRRWLQDHRRHMMRRMHGEMTGR